MPLATYLDNYMGTLHSLPTELKRNFCLMLDLDGKVQSLMKKIDKRSDTFLGNIEFLSPHDKKSQRKKIHNSFNKAREYGDSKVQLAIDSYELVDKFICRMDTDIEKFESIVSALNKLKEKKQNKRVLQFSDDEAANKRIKKKHAGNGEAGGSSSAETDGETQKPSDLLDMPKDLNEPICCICNHVSYSCMIGCENSFISHVLV